MKKLRLHGKRLLCLVLMVTLLLSTCAFTISPPDADEAWRTGYFHYNLSDKDDLRDVYLYNDSWFAADASAENPHLRTMSLIAAMASSASNVETYPTQSANLQSLLQELGFEDIAVNTYYTMKPTVTSAGCCVAHKQLGDSTLLAIFPRSQGYEAEWGSNFTVGADGMHTGFKEGRDEVLRFARQYVTEYGISGKLKVWIAGHSRGAAIANLTAGFLAACPGWLGDLDVKNLYTYTFGTPAGVNADVTAAEICQVAEVGKNDPSGATPGGGTGIITAAADPHDAVYHYIRNYYSEHDFFTRVAPAAWGFTRYGTDTVFDDAWTDAASLAARYEETLDTELLSNVLFGNPAEGFAEKGITSVTARGEGSGAEKMTFGIAPVAGSTLTAAQFLDGRIAMLASAVGSSRESYVSGGYQSTLIKLCSALFGTGVKTDALLDKLKENPEDMADLAAGVLGVYIYYMYLKAESLENSDAHIEELRMQLAVLALGFLLKQDMVRPLLQDALADTEFGAALTDKLMATLYPFFSDAMLYSVPDGMSYSDAMLGIVGARLQPVLSEYGFPLEQSEVQALVRVLAFALFATDDTSFKLPVNIELSMETMDADIRIDPNTAELNTAVTLFSNIPVFGRAHINADILCWMRAKDSAYLLCDLLPGQYEDAQTLHLTGMDGAKLYYTLDGETPAASSALYTGSISLPKSEQYQSYPLNVISVGTDGTSGPVWSFHYAIGIYSGPVNPPTPTDPPAPINPPAPTDPPAPINPPAPNKDPGQTASAKPAFADVADGAYYADAVAWAVEQGITKGTSESTFSPDAFCTRAQIAAFLWRAAGCPDAAAPSTFTDVADDAYYADAVAWAVEQGITKGSSESTFSPDAFCTRAQTATFLWRAAGSPAAASAAFTDVAAGAYYAPAVAWAVERGITKGTSESTFSPDAFCTRAQIVTFLRRQK